METMKTNNSIAGDLLEAARLTRAGRLLDATAAIQRTLRARSAAEAVVADSPPERGGPSGRVIDGVFSQAADPARIAPPRTRGRQPGAPDRDVTAQIQSANRSRCWNWFKRADQRRDAGEPAIIAGMTRAVLDRYGLDARKVYVAGLSAGGAMAAVVGAAYPDLYAAIGIHSGLAHGAAHDLPSALAAMRGAHPGPAGRTTGPTVPVIVFHDDRDATVHPSNGERVVAQSAEDPGAGARMTVERHRVAAGHAYTRTIHRDQSGRTVLEHWLVHGAGHVWFGGSDRGSFTDPKGPDATGEMLRFFGEVRA
jgi:poly(hydroxyalkanoate) depolymerase family esterase